MKVSTGLGIAVAWGFIGAVSADGVMKPPPLKDGLWETRSSQSQQGKVVSSMSMKMCQSKELTKSTEGLGEELRKKDGCTYTATQPSANTYVSESRCAKGSNAGSLTKIIYTHQGDTASRTEVHLNAGTPSEVVTVMDMKYLGNCPADMKPGDAIMADGTKMNLSSK